MYGIIGYPLLQTFSPGYFNQKFEQLGLPFQYHKFPLAHIHTLRDLLIQEPGLLGLNVTIPHKETVIPLLDELDGTAKAIGAVNTIRIREGRLKGFNTDTIGFTQSLEPLLQPWHTHALVLGTGGSSKAVAYALQQLGIAFTLVSRHTGAGQLCYARLDQAVLDEHKLIINTTPLGMAPDTEHCADIPYNYIGEKHLLYDLVYNPAETLFLQKGKAQGAQIKNGYEMLIAQAEAAWRIWNEA
ncbi:shikimate dehydrogenase family protein [Taibaiella koreensis]|uniref:shikimate dehydrogenase family protein n=1 Tax=Taibaiella koreensis TaxID=1268548 RepID=UPI000E59F64D|nr:shikimate dehydrogenase [Taibaiella koreensis]